MRILVSVSFVGCSPLELGPSEQRPSETIPVHHGVNELDDAGAVDALVLPLLEESGVGIGVSIVRDGALVFSGGYGWANLGEDRPLTAETPMQIGSVSKLFIGVAAMQSVEAGRLTLDASIDGLVGFDVDNPHVDGETITLRHLLTHTSSIRDSSVYDAAYATGDPTVSLVEFQRSYLLPDGERYKRANYARHEPGTFEYTNVGSALAGLGIGEAAGLEFAELVERDILGPLGMVDSAYFLRDLSRAPATAYNVRYRPWEDYGFPTYPDGLLRTSPTDLGRFMAAMEAGGVLDETRVIGVASFEEMMTVDETIDSDEGQAIIWSGIDLVEGRQLVGHAGGDPGIASLFSIDREARTGVVFTFNNLDLDGEAVLAAYAGAFDLVE